MCFRKLPLFTPASDCEFGSNHLASSRQIYRMLGCWVVKKLRCRNGRRNGPLLCSRAHNTSQIPYYDARQPWGIFSAGCVRVESPCFSKSTTSPIHLWIEGRLSIKTRHLKHLMQRPQAQHKHHNALMIQPVTSGNQYPQQKTFKKKRVFPGISMVRLFFKEIAKTPQVGAHAKVWTPSDEANCPFDATWCGGHLAKELSQRTIKYMIYMWEFQSWIETSSLLDWASDHVMLIAKINDTPTRLELRKEQLRLLTPTSTCKQGFKSKYTVGQATALHADVSKPADACWQLEQMSFMSK